MPKIKKILVAGSVRSGTTFVKSFFNNYRHIDLEELTNKNTCVLEKGGSIEDHIEVGNWHEAIQRIEQNIQRSKNYNSFVAKFMTTHQLRGKTFDFLEQAIEISDRTFYCKRKVEDILVSLNTSQQTNVWNINLHHTKVYAQRFNIDWILSDDEIEYYARKIIQADNFVIELSKKTNKIWVIDYKKDMYVYTKFLCSNGGMLNNHPSKLSDIRQFEYNYLYDTTEKKKHISNIIKGLK